MRRRSGLLLGCCVAMALAVGLAPLPAYAEDAKAPAAAPTLVVGDRQLDASTQPVVVDGHTLYPVRALAESLGATVAWDVPSQTATITLDDKVIKVRLGSEYAVVNGQVVKLELPATSVDGHAMLPVRFVAESLGAKVDYDATTRTIHITPPDRKAAQQSSTAGDQNPPSPPAPPADGEHHDEDGRNGPPPGSKFLPDGSIQLPDGTIARPAPPGTKPPGDQTPPPPPPAPPAPPDPPSPPSGGDEHHEEGSGHGPPPGSKFLPDGSIQLPDGTIARPAPKGKH